MKYLVKKPIRIDEQLQAVGTILDRRPSESIVKLGLRFGQLEKIPDQTTPSTPPPPPPPPPLDPEKLLRERREKQARGGMATRFKPMVKKPAPEKIPETVGGQAPGPVKSDPETGELIPTPPVAPVAPVAPVSEEPPSSEVLQSPEVPPLEPAQSETNGQVTENP